MGEEFLPEFEITMTASPARGVRIAGRSVQRVGAVADEVFDEAGGGIVDARDAHEAAGAADNLTGDDLAVAGAEGVDDFAARDAGAEDRRERRARVVALAAHAVASMALARS